MEQDELKLMPNVRGLWRRKWLIILTTLGAVLAGVGGSLIDTSDSTPEANFRATATLRIEDQSSADPSDTVAALQLLAGDGTQSIQTHIEVIRSSAVMGRAVNRIRAASGLPEETDDGILDAQARLLANDVRVSQVSRSNLLSVSAIATDGDLARLRTESIVLAYQQLLRDQKLVATQDAIESIDQRIDESSQPALTSTRLKIVVEQLSTSDLDRVDVAVVSSLSQLNGLDLEQFAETTSLSGLVSEIAAASARLQTASIGLTALESQIVQDSGSLSAVPGQQSVDTVQNLAAASLVTVRAIREDYDETSLSIDLVAGIADLANANISIGDAVASLATLNSNLSVPSDDRVALSQLRNQLLALRDSNSSVTNQLSLALNSGGANSADRQRMITQLNAAASTMLITLTSLTEIRQTQTESSALTEIVNVEGRLQSVSDELTDAASTFSADDIEGPSRDLDQLEDLLVDGLERLENVRQNLGSITGGNQLLVAELNGASSVLTSAVDITSSLRVNDRLRIVPSSVGLLSVEPQLNTGKSLLDAVTANISSGSSLTNEVLLERVGDSRQTVDNALAETEALKASLTEANGAADVALVLEALDFATSSFNELVISTQSTSQIIDATAAAGVNQLLASRLTRFSNDLSIASEIFSGTASRSAQTAATIRNLPEVLIRLAVVELEAAEAELAAATSVVDDLEARTSSGQLLTLSDAGEVAARLQIVEAELVETINLISGVDSAELSLTAQNLQSAGSRLRAISSQLSDIEAGETAALDDLFQVRRELQLSVLGPQEIGVALVDTDVEEMPPSSSSVDIRIIAAGFGGFILGILGATVLELMDRTVRRSEDIGDIARVPSLGLVPQGLTKGNPHPPEVTDNPAAVFSEAVHLVTTQIQGRVNDRSRLLLVSSPRPREGKTMMAINLARALSLRSLNVLLIDANFRKPDVSKIFEFENEPGLANALTQNRDPEEFIKHGEDGLDVLPAGQSLVPPVELISRRNTGALLERVRNQYDFVIIDGPPTIGFAESNALAKQAGAVIMVARAGVTKKASLREAVENLSGSEVLGVVMNFVNPKELGYLEHRNYVGRPGRNWFRPRLPGFLSFSKN